MRWGEHYTPLESTPPNRLHAWCNRVVGDAGAQQLFHGACVAPVVVEEFAFIRILLSSRETTSVKFFSELGDFLDVTADIVGDLPSEDVISPTG
jgi:hypothetical protein